MPAGYKTINFVLDRLSSVAEAAAAAALYVVTAARITT